jgi:UDP-N-acetylmuramoylalanine--D-glutamate ligase
MARDFQDKRVVVVGAGRTGLALADYFRRQGASVTLSDQRSRQALPQVRHLEEQGIALDLGGHARELFETADLVVVSPGVSLTTPAVAAALKRQVPVIGEIEVAFSELTAPMVAITGTNGKSTTTSLMGRMFQAWGKRTFVGGNLGTPLIEAVQSNRWDWVVAELSSFQLEAIRTFRPRYALLLNLSEDHLDRYPDMDAYVRAKMRIFENMTSADVAVLNAEDPAVLLAARDIRPRRVLFSSRRLLPEGMGMDGEEIVWRLNGVERRFPVAELRLKGEHNIENVMAALIPPLLEGCPAERAWAAARDFAGLEHRMCPVRVLDGVTWFNDSKGTNIGSVVKSLAGLAAPVTLIAGGKDKGGDLTPLVEPVRAKVAHLILIGQAAARMEGALAEVTHTLRADSLGEAVRLAREVTPPGGSVLLSPGCSSFDMFRDFEERGARFTCEVMALPERKAV